jgi:hypothetical protein
VLHFIVQMPWSDVLCLMTRYYIDRLCGTQFHTVGTIWTVIYIHSVYITKSDYFAVPTPVLQIGGQNRLNTAVPVAINILKGAYSTAKKKKKHTALRCLMGKSAGVWFPLPARLELSVICTGKVRGFEAIGLKCWHTHLSED